MVGGALGGAWLFGCNICFNVEIKDFKCTVTGVGMHSLMPNHMSRYSSLSLSFFIVEASAPPRPTEFTALDTTAPSLPLPCLV